MGSEEDWYTRMMAASSAYYEAYDAHEAAVDASSAARERRDDAMAAYRTAEAEYLRARAAGKAR